MPNSGRATCSGSSATRNRPGLQLDDGGPVPHGGLDAQVAAHADRRSPGVGARAGRRRLHGLELGLAVAPAAALDGPDGAGVDSASRASSLPAAHPAEGTPLLRLPCP
jgi:hypothetical protein